MATRVCPVDCMNFITSMMVLMLASFTMRSPASGNCLLMIAIFWSLLRGFFLGSCVGDTNTKYTSLTDLSLSNNFLCPMVGGLNLPNTNAAVGLSTSVSFIVNHFLIHIYGHLFFYFWCDWSIWNIVGFGKFHAGVINQFHHTVFVLRIFPHVLLTWDKMTSVHVIVVEKVLCDSGA